MFCKREHQPSPVWLWKISGKHAEFMPQDYPTPHLWAASVFLHGEDAPVWLWVETDVIPLLPHVAVL